MPGQIAPFEICVSESDRNPAVRCAILRGYLDGHTVEDFESCLAQQVQDGSRLFILDLSNLLYTSSAGIGALLRFEQMLFRQNGDMVLLKPTDSVMEILRLLDFTSIFKLAASIEEAIALLNQDD